MSKTKLRALVVDDDEMLCNRVLLPLARRAGLDAVAVHTLREGGRLLRDKPFDLAFVDLHLADGVGIDLVNNAKLDPIGRPYIVVVSGTQDVNEVTASWRAGARDFLTKPFSVEDLEEVVERAKRFLTNEPLPLPVWIGHFAGQCCTDDARAMLMARYQGRSNKEVAEQFGLTVSGLKTRLRREFFDPLGAHKLAELDSAAKAWFAMKRRE